MEYIEKHITWKVDAKNPIVIMPIGDAQVGVEAADVNRLKRHVGWGVNTQSAMFLGMGDYVDMASPSNRKTLKSAGLYDTVTEALEAKANNDIELFLGAVKGSEGRWLGLLQGHHYMEMADGTTSDTHICLLYTSPSPRDS